MPSKKAALGRGLDALISTQDDHGPHGDSARVPESKIYDFEDRLRPASRVAEIEITNIDANPFQPRSSFDASGLEELAASIRQLGIIQPITVRSVGNGRFELISGERRLRAARTAGLDRIPSYVREADTEAMLEMAIVENIQREELNPIEVALGYQRLIDEIELTQEQVADKVGKSRASITNMLRLLKLPPFVQALLMAGTLTVGHARALITIEDEAQQQALVEEAVREGLSVRAVERRVQALARRTGSKSRKTIPASTDKGTDPHLQAVCDKLRSKLSTQVQIKSADGAGGRIEVAFYSKDDLERLVDLLLD